MTDQIIYKYKLVSKPGLQTVIMPAGALVLSCQIQDGSIQAWAQVSKSMKYTWEIEFYLAFTGEVLPDNSWMYEFLTTVQFNNLVYHVFRVNRRRS